MKDWHSSLCNLICRKVSNETATGSVSVNRVRTTLTVRIETIEWDTQGCVLRVKGRNIQENQYVKVEDLFHNFVSDSYFNPKALDVLIKSL